MRTMQWCEKLISVAILCGLSRLVQPPCGSISFLFALYRTNSSRQSVTSQRKIVGKHGGKNEASRMVDEGRKEEGRVRTEWRFVPGFSESIRRNKWRKGGRRAVD